MLNRILFSFEWRYKFQFVEQMKTAATRLGGGLFYTTMWDNFRLSDPPLKDHLHQHHKADCSADDADQGISFPDMENADNGTGNQLGQVV